MSIRYAFVTLLTSDAYLPGALAIVASLKDIHSLSSSDQTTEYETVCLVTPETVGVTSIRYLRKAFNVVVGVETIVPLDTESLTLLGRPDLNTALTKLHAFRLTQYAKVIFLDADVLPLRPLSHLFHLDYEFSAVPDVGWPDIFNSGVMVFSPGEDKFKELWELLNAKGSWDGADQGLLNEWRGDDWNRLSFTYNTTPTAIYTYAPAYRRFGPQISVVHFIGPHKPWHSIPFRVQGSSAQSTDMDIESLTETPTAQQSSHNYGSLVSSWHSVYDRHYRSQATEPVFQPAKYTSAWNGDSAIRAGGVLGLEELRRAALEGMGVSRISATRVHGEGEYRTMPLEGRFDLIRPGTRVEREQMQTQTDKTETSESSSVTVELSTTIPEPCTPFGRALSPPSSSPVQWMTLPTPGINEVPLAPHARLISLPPTPLRHYPAPCKPHRTTREVGSQTALIQLQEHELGGEDLSPTPPMWDSVVQTPPNDVTPVPTDTYFPKVWDVDRHWALTSPSPSETSLTTMEASPTKLQSTPDVFFTPSLTRATSEMPRRQGKHRSIIGKESGSPAPDPMKVRRVFPWEERPRRAPGRVFPDEGPPSTTLPHLPVFATPEKKVAFRSPVPSPLTGFPPSFQSHYPSDGPPQRHTGKIPLSVLSSSPCLSSELGRAETSSQDGDVEDEVDSEEEVAIRLRTRSSSIGMVKRTVKYRSVGVQTDPRQVCEEGIQVTTFVPVVEVAEKSGLMNKHWRRNWTASTGIASHPTVMLTHVPASLLSLPTVDSNRSLLPPDLRNHRTPIVLASNETGDLSSSTTPPLSVGSSVALLAPAGSTPPSHIRKGSRVWDPARGVETFRRGSENILTKLMKIGPREERA